MSEIHHRKFTTILGNIAVSAILVTFINCGAGPLDNPKAP